VTASNMDLRQLLEKIAGTDFLRGMIGFTAQRLMELEAERRTAAAHGSRDPDRLTHRNGYRAREWGLCGLSRRTPHSAWNPIICCSDTGGSDSSSLGL
jgi:hypothetical protein